jgi:hypothetical protein
MPHELQKEIEQHLATCPERVKDLQEMQNEWKEYKNKAMWVLLGFSGSILAIGVWVGTMQTTLESVTSHEGEDKARFLQVEARLNSAEVNNAGVLARLASIEVTLQEIKVAVKSLR